jgi:hypothetical protein
MLPPLLLAFCENAGPTGAGRRTAMKTAIVKSILDAIMLSSLLPIDSQYPISEIDVFFG